MIRMIGAVFIVLGAAGIGAKKTYFYHKQVRQLRDLHRAMELIQCEMNYTMYSVPKLLHMTAEQIKGTCGTYFQLLGEQIEQGSQREKSAQLALANTKGLCIPHDGILALLDFSASLGNYDLDGENRMIKLSIQRVKSAVARLEEEKKPMVKSYTVLGASLGVALMILML